MRMNQGLKLFGKIYLAILKKSIQIFNAEKIGFVPTVPGDKTSTIIETGLELPPSRDKGAIFDGPVNEAVSKLVKALRETEKVV